MFDDDKEIYQTKTKFRKTKIKSRNPYAEAGRLRKGAGPHSTKQQKRFGHCPKPQEALEEYYNELEGEEDE